MRHVDPCPFCHSPDTKLIKIDRHEWAVVCNGCRASGPIANIPAKAAEQWSHARQQSDKVLPER